VRKGKNPKSRSIRRHPVRYIFELGTTSSAGIHIDLHSNRHFDNLWRSTFHLVTSVVKD
jgi:hypothetical protein